MSPPTRPAPTLRPSRAPAAVRVVVATKMCFTLPPSSRPLLALRVVPAELIRSKGDTNMTVEQLTAEIIPKGRGA